MGDVINFTGETTLDFDPDEVIEDAKGKLNQVVIVGVEKETGELYVVSSQAHRGETTLLLQLANMAVLEEQVINYYDEDQ